MPSTKGHTPQHFVGVGLQVMHSVAAEAQEGAGGLGAHAALDQGNVQQAQAAHQAGDDGRIHDQRQHHHPRRPQHQLHVTPACCLGRLPMAACTGLDRLR
ncbi:hypothetical protein MMC29_001515 [Sticta canariensis]|nr:hypothetical protein [Sticta canariensis]